MKPIDYAKALALACTIMALEMAITYPVVALYRILIAPGRSEVFYAVAKTNTVVPWTVHIAGPIVFFLAGWLFTGRVRHRNPYQFIAVTCGWYLAIEIASYARMEALVSFTTHGDAAWLALRLAASFLGVYVARRTLPAAEQPVS